MSGGSVRAGTEPAIATKTIAKEAAPLACAVRPPSARNGALGTDNLPIKRDRLPLNALAEFLS